MTERRQGHDVLYGGKDPRDLPVYPLTFAARCIHLPLSTLRTWIVGNTYRTDEGPRKALGLIDPAGRRPPTLSFWNVLEAQILAQIRRVHGVSMPKVRSALRVVEQKLQLPRPLIQARFLTDGVHLFVEQVGGVYLVKPTATGGQFEGMLDFIRAVLARVEHDEQGLAERVALWVNTPDEPRTVVLDPRKSFGRPIIAGTGIAAEAVAERFQAGEPIQTLVDDYGLDQQQVEHAIRFGSMIRGAAA